MAAHSPRTIQRLAVIRLLLDRADEDSRLPAPFGADSINRLHDVAEMFLLLAAEVLNAEIPEKAPFLGYWDPIGKKLGSPLAYKVQMRRVNEARVGFKHHGNEPSSRTLDDARGAVRGLIYDETPRIFGFEFESISLTLFVTSEEARRLVESAEARWAAREELPEEDCPVANAFADLSQAFDVLIANYGQPRAEIRENVFGTPQQPPQLYRDALQRLRMTRHAGEEIALAVLKSLEPFERSLADSLSALELSTRIAGLGVDFRRYGRFRCLAPRVEAAWGDSRRSFAEPLARPVRTQADFDFCRDFVVSVAIHLDHVSLDLPDEDTSGHLRGTTIHRGIPPATPPMKE